MKRLFFILAVFGTVFTSINAQRLYQTSSSRYGGYSSIAFSAASPAYAPQTIGSNYSSSSALSYQSADVLFGSSSATGSAHSFRSLSSVTEISVDASSLLHRRAGVTPPPPPPNPNQDKKLPLGDVPWLLMIVLLMSYMLKIAVTQRRRK